jgi:hypothetical protein
MQTEMFRVGNLINSLDSIQDQVSNHLFPLWSMFRNLEMTECIQKPISRKKFRNGT